MTFVACALLLVAHAGSCAPEESAVRPTEITARSASTERTGRGEVKPESVLANQAPRAARYTLDEILVALRAVETGGEKNGGRSAVGDSGGAIGPYQIHRAYWSDTKLPGRFEDCRDPRYAREVVLAYWRRYCPAALERRDAEALSRVHNGGPDGFKETCTLGFWKKVERKLAEQRAAAWAATNAAPAAPAAAKAKAGDAGTKPVGVRATEVGADRDDGKKAVPAGGAETPVKAPVSPERPSTKKKDPRGSELV